MVLHPVGGDFNHLLSIVNIAIISHAIAIVSVPFVAYGYWGITHRLEEDTFFARVGFSFMFFGLIAVMLAAALNGLILTGFIQRYSEASPEVIDSIKPIMRYNMAFNHAFDFIYIGAVLVSTLFWSIAIVRTKAFPIWIGYSGIILAVFAGALLAAGFVFVDLHGFRLFIFGTVAWTVITGFYLTKTKN